MNFTHYKNKIIELLGEKNTHEQIITKQIKIKDIDVFN